MPRAEAKVHREAVYRRPVWAVALAAKVRA